ncbi:hypothetical protein M427DRAFT_30217 [Gonapodya prolifera JEL478]|uniref:Uncharacterized protein n=1 Tax=Gonapodya prolifera (strain JEL478) TaxID=1344416 RepID=A0A139ALT8_GONPJ|nr:hypothetical protein M427DRAFT_30217 [Gonapodya prolifera JEL478]|eukprot:KXS17747.1 hypothetical protein M427DRAFT_30217 [Gonapodya prolifera JEL478]
MARAHGCGQATAAHPIGAHGMATAAASTRTDGDPRVRSFADGIATVARLDVAFESHFLRGLRFHARTHALAADIQHSARAQHRARGMVSRSPPSKKRAPSHNTPTRTPHPPAPPPPAFSHPFLQFAHDAAPISLSPRHTPISALPPPRPPAQTDPLVLLIAHREAHPVSTAHYRHNSPTAPTNHPGAPEGFTAPDATLRVLKQGVVGVAGTVELRHADCVVPSSGAVGGGGVGLSKGSGRTGRTGRTGKEKGNNGGWDTHAGYAGGGGRDNGRTKPGHGRKQPRAPHHISISVLPVPPSSSSPTAAAAPTSTSTSTSSPSQQPPHNSPHNTNTTTHTHTLSITTTRLLYRLATAAHFSSSSTSSPSSFTPASAPVSSSLAPPQDTASPLRPPSTSAPSPTLSRRRASAQFSAFGMGLISSAGAGAGGGSGGPTGAGGAPAPTQGPVAVAPPSAIADIPPQDLATASRIVAALLAPPEPGPDVERIAGVGVGVGAGPSGFGGAAGSAIGYGHGHGHGQTRGTRRIRVGGSGGDGAAAGVAFGAVVSPGSGSPHEVATSKPPASTTRVGTGRADVVGELVARAVARAEGGVGGGGGAPPPHPPTPSPPSTPLLRIIVPDLSAPVPASETGYTGGSTSQSHAHSQSHSQSANPAFQPPTSTTTTTSTSTTTTTHAPAPTQTSLSSSPPRAKSGDGEIRRRIGGGNVAVVPRQRGEERLRMALDTQRVGGELWGLGLKGGFVFCELTNPARTQPHPTPPHKKSGMWKNLLTEVTRMASAKQDDARAAIEAAVDDLYGAGALWGVWGTGPPMFVFLVGLICSTLASPSAHTQIPTTQPRNPKSPTSPRSNPTLVAPLLHAHATRAESTANRHLAADLSILRSFVRQRGGGSGSGAGPDRASNTDTNSDIVPAAMAALRAGAHLALSLAGPSREPASRAWRAAATVALLAGVRPAACPPSEVVAMRDGLGSVLESTDDAEMKWRVVWWCCSAALRGDGDAESGDSDSVGVFGVSALPVPLDARFVAVVRGYLGSLRDERRRLAVDFLGEYVLWRMDGQGKEVYPDVLAALTGEDARSTDWRTRKDAATVGGVVLKKLADLAAKARTVRGKEDGKSAVRGAGAEANGRKTGGGPNGRQTAAPPIVQPSTTGPTDAADNPYLAPHMPVVLVLFDFLIELAFSDWSKSVRNNALYYLPLGERTCRARALLYLGRQIGPDKEVGLQHDALKLIAKLGAVEGLPSPTWDSLCGAIGIAHGNGVVKGEVARTVHKVVEGLKQAGKLGKEEVSEVEIQGSDIPLPVAVDTSVCILPPYSLTVSLLSVLVDPAPETRLIAFKTLSLLKRTPAMEQTMLGAMRCEPDEEVRIEAVACVAAMGLVDAPVDRTFQPAKVGSSEAVSGGTGATEETQGKGVLPSTSLRPPPMLIKRQSSLAIVPEQDAQSSFWGMGKASFLSSRRSSNADVSGKPSEDKNLSSVQHARNVLLGMFQTDPSPLVRKEVAELLTSKGVELDATPTRRAPDTPPTAPRPPSNENQRNEETSPATMPPRLRRRRSSVRDVNILRAIARRADGVIAEDREDDAIQPEMAKPPPDRTDATEAPPDANNTSGRQQSITTPDMVIAQVALPPPIRPPSQPTSVADIGTLPHKLSLLKHHVISQHGLSDHVVEQHRAEAVERAMEQLVRDAGVGSVGVWARVERARVRDRMMERRRVGVDTVEA